MPYGGIREHGLNFVAFGESLDRFERQLRRMAGRDDGVSDGILVVHAGRVGRVLTSARRSARGVAT